MRHTLALQTETMKRRTIMKSTLTLLTVLLLAPLAAGGAEPSAAVPTTPTARWQIHTDGPRKEPKLVQLYTFAEGQGLKSENLCDSAPFSVMGIAGKAV